MIQRLSASSRNLPNIITFGRIVAVPAIVLCMFWSEEFWVRWSALFIFSAAAISDFFDGYLARAWSQQSSLGRMLDPIADKLLVAAVLMMLVADRTISGLSLAAAMVILCREISVSGLREYLAGLRVSVPVTHVSKWKTTLQLIALGFLLGGPASGHFWPSFLPSATHIGLGLLWISALLTLYTGWDYMKAGLQHVQDN